MQNLCGHMAPRFWYIWSLRVDSFGFNMVKKEAKLIGKLYEAQTLVDILVKTLVFQTMLKQALISNISFFFYQNFEVNKVIMENHNFVDKCC